MAGWYADAPGPRMAWDEDGTIALWQGGSTASGGSDIGSTWKINLNDETENNVDPNSTNSVWYWIFPEPRDVDGVFASSVQSTTLGLVQYATDTTNGVDGTWNTLVSDMPEIYAVVPYYRTNIQSVSQANVQGLRLFRSHDSGTNAIWRAWHMYGSPGSSAGPDRLMFVDDTSGLEFVLPLDYGDVPRGAARDDTFKIKNNSATYTANTVQVTAEALTGASGSWYTFSEGGAFSATLGLASSISTSSSSPTITIRRDVDPTTGFGPAAGRIQISVASWT